MITVFYDGKCGLCRREIEYYKRIAPANIFIWKDITVDASSVEALGITYTDALMLLHAQDQSGRLYKGIDAFLIIWQQLPYWRMLAVTINLPLIRSIANLAYRIFAAWRFKRLEHCQIAAKITSSKK